MLTNIDFFRILFPILKQEYIMITVILVIYFMELNNERKHNKR